MQRTEIPLWNTLSGALADLKVSREVTVETATDYVTGYPGPDLAAKGVVASAALTRKP